MGLLKDYSRKDFNDIRQYLIGMINGLCDKYSNNVWSDRNESDLGMFLIELMAGTSDLLNYNIDKAALETYLITAKQRKNVRRILSIINYFMKPMSGALLYVTFATKNLIPSDREIIIPRYTQVSCSNGGRGRIYYATLNAATILQGETSVKVRAMQGVVNNINLTVGKLKSSRSFEIRSTKIAFGTVKLIVNNEEWTEVEDVLVDEQYGTKFSVHENENDYTYIEFHYSWRNFLPANDSTNAVIQFIVTDGPLGSIKAGLIDSIDTHIYRNGINDVSALTVTNYEGSSGGSDRESIEESKINIPKFLRTGYTLCTLTDYEAFTNMIPGVYKNVPVDWNTSFNNIRSYYVGVPYQVEIYVLPKDEDVYDCSQAFLDYINEMLQPYLWCSITLVTRTAKIRNITVSATVYTRENNIYHSQIRTDVQNALKNYFYKFNRNFGEAYTVGTIENLINHANSMIDYCEILQKETIRLEPVEFPRLTLVTVNVVQER